MTSLSISNFNQVLILADIEILSHVIQKQKFKICQYLNIKKVANVRIHMTEV